MARVARMKFDATVGWYHLCASVAAVSGEYALEDAVVRRKLNEIIKWYAKAYCCQVAGFSIMGNHYHLVLRFDARHEISKEELMERALRFYPRSKKLLEGWPPGRWERFEQRIFDVSEFMRNVQAAFATWYNRMKSRKGRFWADRFKSTLLTTPHAVLECVMYVELNAVRAKLVEQPEDYVGGSLYLREIEKDDWLLPLEDFYTEGTYEGFKELIYHRGAVKTKQNQQPISQALLDRERSRGFARSGVYRKKLRYFTDGLILGSELVLREQLVSLREVGHYLRRKHPLEQKQSQLFALREQRSHYVQT